MVPNLQERYKTYWRCSTRGGSLVPGEESYNKLFKEAPPGVQRNTAQEDDAGSSTGCWPSRRCHNWSKLSGSIPLSTLQHVATFCRCENCFVRRHTHAVAEQCSCGSHRVSSFSVSSTTAGVRDDDDVGRSARCEPSQASNGDECHTGLEFPASNIGGRNEDKPS